MKYHQVKIIAETILGKCAPACKLGFPDGGEAVGSIDDPIAVAIDLKPYCVVGGGIRRGKADCHDIEIVAMPVQKAPPPVFGQKEIFKTYFDKAIADMLEDGILLRKVKGGDRMKQYDVNLEYFGIAPTAEPFRVEFYLCLPPSQWGVLYTIRTGPSDFSHWMVTERRKGGALPDGFICKDNVIGKRVHVESAKEDERDGEIPMPTEADFFQFCGLDWIEPSKREARWGSFNGKEEK